MDGVKKYLAYSILYIVFFGLFANPVFAARVYFEPQPTSYKVGDSFTLSVVLDTENQSVNAVDIKIFTPELLRIKSISKNGSAIRIWVNEPSFSGRNINLTGGIPGGINSSRAVIAKVIFEAAAVGEGNIALVSGSSILLNDGEGTELALKEAGGPVFQVTPRPKETPSQITPTDKPAAQPLPPKTETKEQKDKKKPEKFEILFGRDPNVFGGDDFISFFTTDKDSGIDHYEIKIGKEPFKTAQAPYLIKDIAPRTVIVVRAYDSAGNYRESVYPGLFKRIWWKLITPFQVLL